MVNQLLDIHYLMVSKMSFLINPTVVDVETGLSADIMSKEGLNF